MLVLAIETSQRVASVALANDGVVLSCQEWARQQSSSEIITQLIQDGLHEAGVDLTRVEQLTVTTGPGSFTGVRVGINVARTLGYALNIPIHPVPTHWLLAQFVVPHEKKLMVLVEAFRNLYYVAHFCWEQGQWRSVDEIQALKLEQVMALLASDNLVVGPGISALPESSKIALPAKIAMTQDFGRLPAAALLARLVSTTTFVSSPVTWKSLKPLYVRDSEAEEKLKAGFLVPFKSS